MSSNIDPSQLEDDQIDFLTPGPGLDSAVLEAVLRQQHEDESRWEEVLHAESLAGGTLKPLGDAESQVCRAQVLAMLDGWCPGVVARMQSELGRQEFDHMVLWVQKPLDRSPLAGLGTSSLPEHSWGLPSHLGLALAMREALRWRARLSSISWYARQAAKDGPGYWLRLTASYRGAI